MDLAESIGLSPFTQRDASSGNPLLEEDEALLNKFERLQLILGSDADQGVGTLFTTESRVIWLSDADASKGYAMDFTAISMHAVMTDPSPCLYLQLDRDEDEEFFGAGHAGDGDDEQAEEAGEGEEELPLPELRLVPAAPDTLDAVFQAFCEGAARNPDPEAEEEGGAELFCDEDEVLAGAAEAGIHVNDVDEIGEGDLDRFGDAEEGEEEEEEEEGGQGGAAGLQQ